MKTVGVDNPLRDVAMLDEDFDGFGGLDSLLYARTLTSWGTSSEWAVVLDIEVKFNILEIWVNFVRT